MTAARNALPVLEQIDAAFARGAPAPCQAGCSACCHGPFDISPADAQLVREAIDALPDAVRAQVEQRAIAAVAAYATILPHWPSPYDVDALPEDAFDQLCDALAAMACPALGTDGRCEIYTHRPATCRLMGRAWSVDDRGTQQLDNACPIQEQFPAFAGSAAAPLDFHRIESEIARRDDLAVAHGIVSTTVAGAIASRVPP